MRQILSRTIAICAIFLSTIAVAQPWTYNFGTGTGTANNANSGTGNTSFFTSTPSGGGTYRVRIGTAGGSLVLANPGTTLGTDTEVQLNAATSTATNKFTVYDWTSPTTVAYVKAKIRTTATATGNLAFALGVNTLGSDNQGYTSHYNNSVTVFAITYTAGSISAVNRRISGSNTAITGSGLAKDTDQLIEVYANNGAASTTYTKGVTSYTLNSQTWDLWVDGTKISPANGWPKAGSLAAGGNIAGFGFFAESSSTNNAFLYIDDIEYSNAFPSCTAPATQTSNLTFSAVTTSTLDLTWTNGDGAGRVVKMNTSNSFTAPTDGSNPTANLDWQNSGEQVVYNGTATGPITITGLNQNTTYHFRSYEYCDTQRNYQSATATGNPSSQTTATGPGLSSGTLTPFGAQCTGSSYGPNMFTVTGSNLTGANVTVTTALTQYKFSENIGGPFTASLSLPQGGGAYSQDIYVEFTPSAVATYNGNIVVGGGGATSINVAVSGSGISSAVPSLNAPASSLITATTATLEANISSVNCSDVTTRGFEWSTLNGFANGAGTPVTESGIFGTGVYSLLVTGLPSNSTIYWKAFATNSSGTTYSTQQTFTTAQEYLSVGDISIIAMNCNTPDNLAFVNWVSIPNNMVIKFTDGGFNGVGAATDALNARGTESFVIWKNTTGNAIAPGTVIKIEGVTASLGTATDASASGTALDGLATGGEQIFAYQGAAVAGNNPDYASTAATTTLTGNVLYGIHMPGSGPTTWLSSGSATSNSSYLPTELNVTDGNIVMPAASVGAQYTATRSALGSIIAYRDLVNDPANWTAVNSGVVTVNTTAFTINPNVATQINVTSINGGINPSVNTPFTVSIEVLDASNNPAAVSINTNFLVSLFSGSGALAGTLTGTMTGGSGTLDITGVLYNTAEGGVSVTVTRTSGQALTSATSSTFTVDPAADHADFVNLETYVYTSNNIPTFSVEARRLDNSVDVNYDGSATVSLFSGTGTLLGTLTKPVTDGVAFFNDIAFDDPGVKEIQVTVGLLPVQTSSTITVSTATLTEIVLPEYIEGKQPTNTNRVPFAYRVELSGLKPNSTFRYINSVVLGTDAATSNGAGNAIYAYPSGFIRSGGTSLSSAGNYGEFTTDGSGNYSGWFITEPTGNSTRFNPGADVYCRIILNNGNNGTAPTVRLTTTNSVRVLEFGTLANQGTALRGNSNATPKNFLFVYNNTTGSGRPISGTFIESDGSLNDDATNSYSTFYSANVDGVAGAYGLIIPNTLANGIRRIETRELLTGELAGCSSTDADGIWPGGANTVNPNGGITTPRVILVTDAPLAPSPETCDNYIDDDCDGLVDELCPGNFANDIPGGAINVSFSGNVVYPNCYPINGNNTIANNSAESGVFNGPDSWYRFVAQSEAVSITMSSTTMDDAIALYSKDGLVYTLLDSENASVGLGDFERLNYTGLTPGLTYFVSAGSVDPTGGPFTLCIQHLMPSGCASTAPVGGFNLCSPFKAIYRGASGSGVSYDFSFTGVGGGASGTTSLSGTNGLITLSNPTLGLRYGGIYDVQVDVNYALTNSAGGSEPIAVDGSVASANCSGVTMRAQPNVEVKLSQRCLASLLRSNWLIGVPVAGDPYACGVINYTYEFTQVNSCIDGTINGAATEYTTAGASAYLPLGVLTSLPNNGAWNIRIRPNFSYGIGSYGPVQRISVAGTSASAMLPGDAAMFETEKSEQGIQSAVIYPNPNNGEVVNLNITDITSEEVFVRVLDGMGRVIYSARFTANGSLNTMLTFAKPLTSGLYMVELTTGTEVNTHRMIVQK